MCSSNAHGFTLPFIHSHVRFDCGFDFLYIYNLYIQQNQIANPFIQIFVQYCMDVHVCECVCCVFVKLLHGHYRQVLLPVGVEEAGQEISHAWTTLSHIWSV